MRAKSRLAASRTGTAALLLSMRLFFISGRGPPAHQLRALRRLSKGWAPGLRFWRKTEESSSPWAGKSRNWRNLSRETLALRDSIRHIEQQGPRILVAQADQTHTDEVQDYGLALAPCLAVIERSALVSTLFTISGKQVIRARPAYRGQVETGDGDLPGIEQLEMALDERASDVQGENAPYWRLWQNKFDYVYVVFSHRGAPNPFPSLLTAVYDGDHFQLYRITKPGEAGNGGRQLSGE